jgi:RNase P subunit RPR2
MEELKMEKIYDYDFKYCIECHSLKKLEWLGYCISEDKIPYDKYICKDCGAKINIRYKKKEKSENTGYYHDGGWYRDNE